MEEFSERNLFLEAYERYVADVLEPTKSEIAAVLHKWREREFWAGYQKKPELPIPSPVHRTRVRIKRPESAEDKIQRKPESFPEGLVEKSLRDMHDAVGARVVSFFLSDLPIIDTELRKQEGLELSEEHPPVAYLAEDLWHRLGLGKIQRRENPSGYASIHYLARLTNSGVPKTDRPWFEIQVRTLTEDVWAEIEHLLGYKPEKRTYFAVKEQFRILSKLLGAVDEHFDFLRDELERLQEQIEIEDDARLNAENLPRVLSGVGIGVAQLDIDGLLKILSSYGVDTVEELRHLARPDDVALIRKEWEARTGDVPDNFGVIATLVTFLGVQNEAQKVQRIIEQIAVGEFWENRRRDL